MREEFDPDSVERYKNSIAQDLEANKQIQKKIDQAFRSSSKLSLSKYESELKEKNNYYTKTKLDQVNQKDLTMQETNLRNRFKSSSTLDTEKEEAYCQKCPTGKNHCPHKIKKDQIKDKYSYPIVSSSVYGWMPPIDNMIENHNLKSATKTFYDHSHL